VFIIPCNNWGVPSSASYPDTTFKSPMRALVLVSWLLPLKAYCEVGDERLQRTSELRIPRLTHCHLPAPAPWPSPGNPSPKKAESTSKAENRSFPGSIPGLNPDSGLGVISGIPSGRICGCPCQGQP
jgi:hypothetical protein